MNVRKNYRRFVLFLLILSMIALGYSGVELLKNQIPDQILVSEEEEFSAIFPSVFKGLIQTERVSNEEPSDSADKEASGDEAAKEASLSGNESKRNEEEEAVQVSCSLLGQIRLKTVNVTMVPRDHVYAGGTPIGIYLETDGVLVVDTGAITGMDGRECCPAENIVKSGDYIQSVNGRQVSTKEELISRIGECDGSDVILAVARGEEQISLRVTPVQDADGNYRAGIWVRNDTQGIGTLTYLEEDGSFGALGHGISDIDTGEILDVRGGTLYDADVVSVVKGQQGVPGELSGVIHYSEGYKIGEIRTNSQNGIFGTVSNLPGLIGEKQLYETAHKQEVETGKAAILSSVDGTCREYEIIIKEIRLNGKEENKGMVLEVTDEELLEKTGGIVQGMSGSPIIQNGRVIGAVTHVFVNDPTKGYGIFIENMLEH